MVNTQLLERTMDYIDAHPEEHHQAGWRTKDGLCFAAIACTLAGGEWLTESAGAYNSDLLKPDDRYDEHIETIKCSRDGLPVGTKFVVASDRANSVLGLTDISHSLFAGSNNRHTLHSLVDNLCKEYAA